MGRFATLHTQKINGFEELTELVAGNRRDIVQVERGMLEGEIQHASIGDLSIDTATFNVGIRTRGGSHRERVGLSMIAGSADRVARSSYDSRPGDVLAMQPGGEHENRYFGGASLIVVMISPADIEASFATEGRMRDPSNWWRQHFKGNAETVNEIIPRLRALIDRLGDVPFNADAAEFWKRAVIEAIMANIVAGMPAERDGPLPSALKTVRRVEEYLEARTAEAVHISEICTQLHVSRRTLHRAFDEALGIGPIAFLRHRRLCAIHTKLRAGQSDTLTISDLAFRYGFQNVGRFAGYYHDLFGEYPSATRRRQQRPRTV